MINFQTQQILVPKKVYIGDAAELRVSFNSQEALSAEGFAEELNFKDYTVQDVKLLPSGVNYYQLTITFIPWKTGDIQFPDYEFKLQNGQDETYKIKFEPVNIVSIIEQNGISTLRDSQAPLLLPGTAYKLYGMILVLVFLVITGLQLIIKRKTVALFFKNQKLLRIYRKNRRQTLKSLAKLKEKSKEDIADNILAGEIQKLMRNYLEVRFAYPFKNCVTSQIMQGFNTATGGMLQDEKQEAAQEIAAAFIRTDYIRYGNNAFNENERQEIIEKLSSNIDILEKEVKNV